MSLDEVLLQLSGGVQGFRPAVLVFCVHSVARLRGTCVVGTARLELARCEVRAEVQIIPYEGALVPATHTGLRSQVERRAAPVKQTSRLL